MKAAQVKVALVPGGAHPYFQPWKTAGAKAKTDFGLGDVSFNETSGWDQTKQNDVLTSMAAQGYNAFGIFGVAPENINTTFDNLKKQGFHVALAGLVPGRDTDDADFCLSTDVQQAAYKAAKAAIEAMGGSGNLVHLTGNKVDSNTQRRMAGVQQAVERDRRQGEAARHHHRHRHRPADRPEGGGRRTGRQGQADQRHRQHRVQPGGRLSGRGQAVRSADQGHRDRRRPDHYRRTSRTVRSQRPCCRTRSARPTSARTR